MNSSFRTASVAPPTTRGSLRALIRFAAGLLLVAALGSGPLAGATLCFGADGHVEIERAAAGHCASDSERAPGATPALRDDCCGPCTDVETRSKGDLSRRLDPEFHPPGVSCGSAPGTRAWSRRALRPVYRPGAVRAMRDRAVLPLVLRC